RARHHYCWTPKTCAPMHSRRSVLQRFADEIGAFGDPLRVSFYVLLVQNKARSLRVAPDAHYVTNEAKCCPLACIPMNKPPVSRRRRSNTTPHRTCTARTLARVGACCPGRRAVCYT